MANLIGGNTIGIDMFDWQDWGFDQFQSSSKAHYEYLSHNGNTVRVSGTEFSFDEDGYPVKGTVNQLEIFDDNGNQIASLVLGDAPLGDLAANGFNSLWEVLLKGDDAIFTGHQSDYIAAHDGNDTAWGGGGDDNIFGGDGDDILNGENGDDTVFGDAGDDTIIFNPDQGNDRIFGGEGEDTVVTHGVQSPHGDIVHIERIAAKDVDPQGPNDFKSRSETPPEPRALSKTSDDAPSHEFAATPSPEASEDYNVLLEVGTTFGGTTGLEVPRTEAVITSVETIEVLTGDHNDSLRVDALNGTSLADGRIIYDGGAGSDNLNALDTATEVTYVWKFEEGEGHPGGGLVRFGHSDQDTVHLIDNADEGISVTLDLTNLTDTFKIIAGVTGAPFTEGLSVWNAERVDLDFGAGDDRVIVNEDLAAGYDGTIEIDFGDGTNLLDVYDHNGRIEAVGGGGNNSYYSGGGDDLLIGGEKHDEIFGGDGDDEIYGGGGFDEIGGGAGDDHIWGGAEGDRFSFEQGSGTDTIYDFVAGDAGGDVLDFLSLNTTLDQLQISQVEKDTHITTEFGDTVILQNVAAKDLNSGDFLF